MKIVLSRKGFDSKYGGIPSPILPDGTLLSIPIPVQNEINKYSDLYYGKKSLLEIINELSPKTKINEKDTCHLDPDIRYEVKVRSNNWVPLFGQNNAAQGHLINQEIEKEDIFLFFGWFRQTELIDGKLCYKKEAPDLQIIFGYLQIGNIFYSAINFPKEFQYHPHAQKKLQDTSNNCIYRSAETLSWDKNKSGAGCFSFNNKLVLTKKGFTRSKWDLPENFRDVKISYHSKKSFKEDYFQSAFIGQEFVVEGSAHIIRWAKSIIKIGMRSS